MTEPQRAALRRLIDHARRQRIKVQPYYEPTVQDGYRICAHCRQPFEPTGRMCNHARQRFCCDRHRRNYHVTESRRRQREQARTVAA